VSASSGKSKDHEIEDCIPRLYPLENDDFERFQIMKIATGQPLQTIVFRGADSAEPHLDPDRGVFFSSDQDYARNYGEVVCEYEISLQKPLVVTEEQSHGNIEIDRNILLAAGYDGRIIAYDDGNLDIVCFELSQATFIREIDNSPTP